jgi:hypothetical protein
MEHRDGQLRCLSSPQHPKYSVGLHRFEGQKRRKYARVSLTRQFDTADLLRRGEEFAWYALPAVGMLYFLCLRQRGSTLERG